MSKTRVVLIFSLGLNLLVLGVVLGHAWRGGFDRGPLPLSWGLRSLSPEARAQVMPRLRENLQESWGHRRALRQAVREVEAAVGREPFDRPGLTEALAVLRGATNAFQQQMHERALVVLAELSPEDRRAVAALLLRPGPHRHGAPGQGGRPTGGRPPGPPPGFEPSAGPVP
ncbi:MAG: periplasmic heavy metal sensor [Pseudomonadales bacterium]|nr:periplasmic heavy metal sensor [Pseudomonadales bacterium]